MTPNDIMGLLFTLSGIFQLVSNFHWLRNLVWRSLDGCHPCSMSWARIVLYTLPMNFNRFVPILINTLDIIIRGSNMQTASGGGVLLCRGCLTWVSGKPSICVTRPTLLEPQGEGRVLPGSNPPCKGKADVIEECQRGPLHFWNCRACLGNCLAPWSTLEKALCRTCPFSGASGK